MDNAAVIERDQIQQNNDEWMNGLLEFWIHPFLPLIEFLPTSKSWGLSNAYIGAVCTSYGLALEGNS
jgi:hypothetical protein